MSISTASPHADPVTPFAHITTLVPAVPLRAAITAAWRLPETVAVPTLLAQARLPAAMAERVEALALRVVGTLRSRRNAAGKAGLVQGLLQTFSLSSQEGIALMCLAEALLRIPDPATRDALIRDKIGRGNWREHVGQEASLFVNAAAWGLVLTGKLVATHSEQGLGAALGRLIARGGEPLIRKGVDMAMRMLGEQFVTGETMPQALQRARIRERQGFRYSYDMLGEAALTAADAQRYFQSYEQAIHAIGQASAGLGVYEGPGISIKLSALHPRYGRAQIERVQAELYPALLRLARLASDYDIGLNIDAEEADRLELSLDLLERLCAEPTLKRWQGIGFVIQAYQKRCPFVIDYLIDLARRSGHRLMIRLVKGAYWDSEIKRAQVDGMADYPVYTRKSYTDLSYLVCARKLLAAPDAVYPQFATHNAQTLAAVYELADPASYTPGQYEFQCLHGMGEPLYEQVVGPGSAGGLARPCRIYAPVGTHETLLAYLVRRLLENGANTSFVNRVADPAVSLAALVRDPVAEVEALAGAEGQYGLSHPGIPLPEALYGAVRRNAPGLDLASDLELAALQTHLRESAAGQYRAVPMLAESVESGTAVVVPPEPVYNPADRRDQVGEVSVATDAQIDAALQAAEDAAPAWAACPPAVRAERLERAADTLQAARSTLIGLLVREAGKTYANAIAEVREAIDFLCYYAAQARAQFDPATHRPLGAVVCISPWNFPLAIFTGQVAAALAAGNTVLAKPAEQTPLIAARAVALLWQAGIPRAALQLLPGDGARVGARLVADARTQAVMFTGSTEVARVLQRTLAARLGREDMPVPLIAETGGQNAMIVDASALTEQVVQDVVMSAFDSAGQRCSALRVLCVQEEAADRLLAMLKGAMAELRLGDPSQLSCDVGPVIDAEAKAVIDTHIAALRAKGRAVHQLGRDLAASEHGRQFGSYVLPTLIELPSLADLSREVFGPVLHVLRYRREQLDDVLAQIRRSGYGLTMGLHTRIEETIDHVAARVAVGNLYVNRNTVGAVVGVQPFGGEGLSGTGPKAGGPLYLYRLLAARPDAALAQPFGATPQATRSAPPASQVLSQWLARQSGLAALPVPMAFFCGGSYALVGPTGESNHYLVLPRRAVLGIAECDDDRLAQLAAVLALGGRMIWDGTDAAACALHARLPALVRAEVMLVGDLNQAEIDAMLLHGDVAARLRWQQWLAKRDGMIVGLVALAPGQHRVPLERLVVERALSINTAAAGGNASLMTMA